MASEYCPPMSPNTLLSFSAATLILLVIPGPAVMYIVTRSPTQGRRAGLVSVGGIHLCTVAHVLAAMIGLSAVLAPSATAFSIVKFVGATYLIWLGIESLRSTDEDCLMSRPQLWKSARFGGCSPIASSSTF